MGEAISLLSAISEFEKKEDARYSCQVSKIKKLLDIDSAEALERIISDRAKAIDGIVAMLKENNITASASPLHKHRNKKCGCFNGA